MKISPCMNCEERHRACHDACEKYKNWAVEQKAEKKYAFTPIYDATTFTPASQKRHDNYLRQYAGHIRYKKR